MVNGIDGGMPADELESSVSVSLNNTVNITSKIVQKRSITWVAYENMK